MTGSLSAPAKPIAHASRWHLIVSVITAVAAQLLLLTRKDVLILEWRPTDLASIALNYYRNGFHFLHPQVLWGGTGSGYVEMEFPLIPYSVARLYAVFGVHDWAALVIPVLCGIGLVIVMHLFTTRFFGSTAGLIAGLFVATSPTWLDMSTGLWPDAPPIFFGAAGLFLLARWVEDEAKGRFALAAACISLSILLKLTSLYIALPIVFSFWVKYRRRLWSAWQVWLFAALVLVPSVLWYAHAYKLFLESHNTFGIIGSGYMKFGTVDLLTSPRFYVRTLLRVVLAHLTPLGALLVAIGGAGRSDRPIHYLFHVWFSAVLIYFLVTAQGVNLGHYQYALPIVPPGAALAGRGVVAFLRWLESGEWSRSAFKAVWPAVIFVLLAANAVAANYVYESRGTNFRLLARQKMRTGNALARLTVPGNLVVVVDADMDDRTPETSMTPPEVFYFSDRRGWYRAMSWLTPAVIEDLRAQGAHYLAVSANHVRYFRSHYAAMYTDCSRRYRTLMDNEDGIIYDLTAAPGNNGVR